MSQPLPIHHSPYRLTVLQRQVYWKLLELYQRDPEGTTTAPEIAKTLERKSTDISRVLNVLLFNLPLTSRPFRLVEDVAGNCTRWRLRARTNLRNEGTTTTETTETNQA